MENKTNKILTLADGKKFMVIRQAVYKGVTYFLCNGVNEDKTDFTEDMIFFEEITTEDGKIQVKSVTDPDILKILFENVDL